MVQEEPLCTCFIYETEFCTWTIQTFVSGKQYFVHNAGIGPQFDHLVSPLGFRFSVHRALNNTEMVLFSCVLLLLLTMFLAFVLNGPRTVT